MTNFEIFNFRDNETEDLSRYSPPKINSARPQTTKAKFNMHVNLNSKLPICVVSHSISFIFHDYELRAAF